MRSPFPSSVPSNRSAPASHAEAVDARALLARLEQHLQADAHREDRRAAAGALGEHIGEAGVPQARHGRPEGADAGQHQALGVPHHGGLGRDPRRDAEPAEGRQHRGEVGGAGRQHHHLFAHSTPLVLGT